MRAALLAWTVICAAPLVCNKPAPPPPPSPAPTPAPPPPPPKCEAIDEGCVVKAGATAVVAAGWTIELPEGWTYATKPDAVAEGFVTLAVTKQAAFAVTTRPAPDAKKPPRDEAMDALLGKLAVSFPKRKGKLTWPRKPDKTIKVTGLQVALYQFDGAERDAKRGPVLAFTTLLPDKTLLSGAGFVAEDDSSNADAAILHAIESLKAAPP